MKMLWCVVMFLITLLLESLYHNYDFYESILNFIVFMIFHFILACAFVNLTDTSLPRFKTFKKDSCDRPNILLDYVKDSVDDKPYPNLLNMHPISTNLRPNSPSPDPSSSHIF